MGNMADIEQATKRDEGLMTIKEKVALDKDSTNGYLVSNGCVWKNGKVLIPEPVLAHQMIISSGV